MVKCEVMYIIRPELDEQEMEQKVVDIVVQSGGNVTKKELWGKKWLAYEIDGCTRGRYGLIAYNAVMPCQVAGLIKKALDESKEVLRHMIISVGE